MPGVAGSAVISLRSGRRGIYGRAERWRLCPRLPYDFLVKLPRGSLALAIAVVACSPPSGVRVSTSVAGGPAQAELLDWTMGLRPDTMLLSLIADVSADRIRATDSV